MAVILTAFYIIILLLILLVDGRERRILNVLALPGTLVALGAGLTNGREMFLVALFGALLGFLFFSVLYWIGGKMYGSNALGFGDVKLAMLLGAVVGIHQVFLVLASGMLLAGLAAVVLLMANRERKDSTLLYGAFLAFAGIVALVWTNL
jgi:leader peptidase (prepilin peptidase)/N-methyltransferase